MLFLSNSLGQLAFLAGFVHLAKVLGPASFGLWNLAQAWMLYLLRFGDPGLEVVGIRSIARGTAELSRLVGDVIGIRLMLTALLMIAVLLLGYFGFLPPGGESLIPIFSLTLFPVAVILEWVFEAHQAVGLPGAARILKGVVFGALILAFVSDRSQIATSVYIYVGSFTLGSIMVAAVAIRKYRLLPLSFSRVQARRTLSEGLPIGVATVLSQYSLFIGTFLIGYISTQQELGYYTAAQRLVIFVWAYGIVTSNRVLLPRLSRLFHESSEEFFDFVRRVVRVLIVVSMPLGIVLIAGAPSIISLLYGVQYQPSALVLRILGAALIVGIIRSVIEIALIASDRQGLYMKGMIGLSILYTCSTLAGIWQWGIAGAAWASVASECCYMIYLLVVFSRSEVPGILALLWQPFMVACTIVGLLAAARIESLPIIIVGGIAAYLGVLAVTGYINRDDFLNVKEILTLEVKSA